MLRERSEEATANRVVFQNDVGDEVISTSPRAVTDDFGIQVTDNPIWAGQRLDPGLAIHTETSST